MKVNTNRFGELEVKEEEILHFAEGILGFENLKRFFVVDPGDSTLILWIQSIDDASIAFPIIEPQIFLPNYSIALLPAELNSLNLETVNEASSYVILTIPSDVTQMTANLKAPIIINNKTKASRQIVLQDNKLDVKFEMYKELKKVLISYSPSDDRMRTKIEIRSHEPVQNETDTAKEKPNSLEA